MDNTNGYAALFDLDGVVMNTEPQYTVFWDEQGMRYLGIPDFCSRIKGQTLTQIYDAYFQDKTLQRKIRKDLNDFEHRMVYDYVSDANVFIDDLRHNGVLTALVTSSNNDKMNNVYTAHPEFSDMFDSIITADMFVHSKPSPECFLVAMQKLGTTPQTSVVFEDSFHGLTAGRESGAYVVGLATTNPRKAIADKANFIIPNFVGLNARWFFDLMINQK